MYLAYRWILSGYFLAWLIVSIVEAVDGTDYGIHITNWIHIVHNLYLFIGALSSTIKYLTVHFLSPSQAYDFSRSSEYEIKKPSGCCGYADNKLSWYQSVHWFFFALDVQLAFGLLLMYWSLYYGGWPVDAVNLNTHVVTGLVFLIDVWISGLPVNLLHAVYPTLFVIIYLVFSAVYYVTSGGVVLYGILDYGANLGHTIGIWVVVLVCGIAVVLVMYLVYLVRYWLLYYCLVARRQGSSELEYKEIEQESDSAQDSTGF